MRPSFLKSESGRMRTALALAILIFSCLHGCSDTEPVFTQVTDTNQDVKLIPATSTTNPGDHTSDGK